VGRGVIRAAVRGELRVQPQAKHPAVSARV
jgi:hypothetical protein